MRHSKFLLTATALATLIALSCSCGTKVWTVARIQPTALAAPTASSKIPLVVELRMSPEYRGARWVREAGKAEFEIPFGDALVRNTEECGRAVFQKVISTSQAKEAPPTPGTSAFLLPRLVRVDTVFPFVVEQTTSMALEWSLYDSAGKLVWVDTFKAETCGLQNPKGWQRQFDDLFRDIFAQSHKKMTASPDILDLARRVSAPQK